jgi:hypothetical protein
MRKSCVKAVYALRVSWAQLRGLCTHQFSLVWRRAQAGKFSDVCTLILSSFYHMVLRQTTSVKLLFSPSSTCLTKMTTTYI